MGSRTLEDLLSFLRGRGIAPWRASQAAWDGTSSATWWGADTGDTSFVNLAAQVVQRVVPDLLSSPEVAGDGDDAVVGAVLCFLPGWAEIKAVNERLEDGPHSGTMWVLRLHSMLEKEQQQLVFDRAPEGKVKVILATNIAESSVTIDDVRVVVDAGLHREMTYDPKHRLSTIDTVWISQSNAVQRKGRAGRVRSGQVYRLYTQEQFESVPWRPAPEMQRCDLAQTCLQVISLGRDPRVFLASAPDPPSVAAVEAAMAELVCMDAVCEGVPPRLLPVGQVMSRMPLEPALGRAMMMGTLFGIPQQAAALLAVSGGQPPFVCQPGSAGTAQLVEAKKRFCNWSDVVAALRAVAEFEGIYKGRGPLAADEYSRHMELNAKRCTMISRIKFQLLQDGRRSGILDSAAADGMNPEEWLAQVAATGQRESGALFQEDGAGAIMEAQYASRGLATSEWREELESAPREVENEQLLVSLLCCAFPANIACRDRPSAGRHSTATSYKATISRRSVNNNFKKESVDASLPSPSWWLYGDQRMYESQTQLENTTRLDSWQVALFSGLRVKEDLPMQIDNWITVRGATRREEILAARLRREIREALVWLAIAASWDSVAQAATARAMKLFAVLSAVLQGTEPSPKDVEYLKNWRLPKVQAGETAVSAGMGESREDLVERLWMKTVAELKLLLRELGEEPKGIKKRLVHLAADRLLGAQGLEPETAKVQEAREELAMMF